MAAKKIDNGRETDSRATGTNSGGWSRRAFLRGVSGVSVAGLFAGCLNDATGGTDDTDDAGSVEEWLADTDNYNGTVDRTDTQSVTIEVGAEGNNGTNAFSPAAVQISPGTSVTWKWIEGYHNVVATDGRFNSGEPEENATFEQTFETTGTFQYYCTPHKSMGMKGAVVVTDSAVDDNATNG